MAIRSMKCDTASYDSMSHPQTPSALFVQSTHSTSTLIRTNPFVSIFPRHCEQPHTHSTSVRRVSACPSPCSSSCCHPALTFRCSVATSRKLSKKRSQLQSRAPLAASPRSCSPERQLSQTVPTVLTVRTVQGQVSREGATSQNCSWRRLLHWN